MQTCESPRAVQTYRRGVIALPGDRRSAMANGGPSRRAAAGSGCADLTGGHPRAVVDPQFEQIDIREPRTPQRPRTGQPRPHSVVAAGERCGDRGDDQRALGRTQLADVVDEGALQRLSSLSVL